VYPVKNFKECRQKSNIKNSHIFPHFAFTILINIIARP